MQAVGLVSNDWKYAGKELFDNGRKEVDKAKFTAKGDATVGGLHGAGQRLVATQHKVFEFI
jgi:hypothetical protein